MTYESIYTPDAIRIMEADGLLVPSKEVLTCSKCPRVDTCDLAWDPYNTDGDCLANK